MIKFHLFLSIPTKVPAWMDLPNLQETDTLFLVQIILERRKRKKGAREEKRRKQKREERKGGGGRVYQVMKFL